MEKSTPEKRSISLECQEISQFLWKRTFTAMFTAAHHKTSILSQKNSIPTFYQFFINFNFNIIFPSVPAFPKWFSQYNLRITSP